MSMRPMGDPVGMVHSSQAEQPEHEPGGHCKDYPEIARKGGHAKPPIVRRSTRTAHTAPRP